MELNLLSKISKLTFYGYYDPSKKAVTVHFFNESEKKQDIIAYLKKDMSWDVREIVSETSTLESDSEHIVIVHNPLGIYEQGGDFDRFIREGLLRMGQGTHGEDAKLTEKDPMFVVLEDNSYDGVE